MLVSIDASAAVPDSFGFEIQRVPVGDAPGAVHDPISLDLMLGATVLECQAQAAIAGDDAHRAGSYFDANPLAFGADFLNCGPISCFSRSMRAP